MRRSGLVRSLPQFLLVALCLGLGSGASGAEIAWVDWQAANVANSDANGGSANGTVSPGGVALVVSYAGEVFLQTQVDGTGTDHWSPDSTWADGSIIDNAPAGTDIIALRGNPNSTNTITFSRPVANPVMAIFSLGSAINPASYAFDAPFDVVAGGASEEFAGQSVVEQANDMLLGEEGNGTIRFLGTFSSIAFTVPDDESWHGFTIGVPVPAPTVLPLFGSGLVALAGLGSGSCGRGGRS